MRAVVPDNHGSPDVLRLDDVPLAAAGDGDSPVRVREGSSNTAE
jgi:hypothetical protein